MILQEDSNILDINPLATFSLLFKDDLKANSEAFLF